MTIGYYFWHWYALLNIENRKSEHVFYYVTGSIHLGAKYLHGCCGSTGNVDSSYFSVYKK